MRKGQEGAPIELLIGVTILTFVLIIGIFSFRNVCISNYEQSLEASLSLFARTMEIVYLGSIDSSQIVELDFSPPEGCVSEVESVRMLAGLAETCRRNTGRDDCLEIVVVVRDQQGNYNRMINEIINMPSDIQVLYYPVDAGVCNINNLPQNNWESPEFTNCKWRPMNYRLRVTKTAQDEITIGPV